ncbi:hypothetical protein [Streptomyces sp. NPDC053542]|uniref:hypothetical protein n=1 Tax=Streptomyces sp. NPDC053542 TaxID=3365710 RepID=UPI0037D8D2D3
MTLHRYRCDRCRKTWPPVATPEEADAQRARHRAIAHSGAAPDGDDIWRVEERPVDGVGLSRPARRMLIGIGVGGTVMAVWNWVHGR